MPQRDYYLKCGLEMYVLKLSWHYFSWWKVVGTMEPLLSIISSLNPERAKPVFVIHKGNQSVVQLTLFKGTTVSLLTTETSCQCDPRHFYMLEKQGTFIFSSTGKLYKAHSSDTVVSHSFVQKDTKKWSALLSVTMALVFLPKSTVDPVPYTKNNQAVSILM